MSTVNIFEQASRKKLRFDSIQGLLTVEDLWGLDLKTSKSNRADLNSVAVVIASELEGLTAKSFVDDGVPHPRKASLELALEVVKHIIATLKAENASKAQAAKDRAELETLTDLLADKQNEALKGLSLEEIQAKIKKLRGDAA